MEYAKNINTMCMLASLRVAVFYFLHTAKKGPFIAV